MGRTKQTSRPPIPNRLLPSFNKDYTKKETIKKEKIKNGIVTRSQSNQIKTESFKCFTCGHVAHKRKPDSAFDTAELLFTCLNDQCEGPKKLIACSKCSKIVNDTFPSQINLIICDPFKHEFVCDDKCENLTIDTIAQ